MRDDHVEVTITADTSNFEAGVEKAERAALRAQLVHAIATGLKPGEQASLDSLIQSAADSVLPIVAKERKRTKTAERSRDAWEADASRYAENADYWRSRTERAEAQRPSAPL
jgi:hypothetical protein